MTRGLRRLACTLALFGVLGALAGCELPPPPTVVSTTADGHDLTPGDGICEVTEGAGDCSFRAAVDEANAGGATQLDVPAGVYAVLDELGPITVTALVRVNPTAPHAITLGTPLGPSTLPTVPILRVEAGAQFSAENLTIAGGTVVGGILALRRSMLSVLGTNGISGTLVVEAGGHAFLENTIVDGLLASALMNAGRVDARHATFVIQGSFGGVTPAVLTTGAGETALASSLAIAQPVLRAPVGLSCGGTPPISLGYNAAKDTTCSLTGPGDVVVAPESWDTDVFGPTFTLPNLGTAMVDAIPLGTNGCGTEVTVDLAGNPRPVDGDGDYVAACDMGARERPSA